MTTLIGTIASKQVYDHTSHDGVFYRMDLAVERASGVIDVIPILVNSEMIYPDENYVGWRFRIDGDFRSHRDDKNRLLLYVFVHDMIYTDEDSINLCNLEGFICTQPTYRVTKTGREISDFTLAVNRAYNKSDYIPCIAWGANAQKLNNMWVGDKIAVSGRIQSRPYDNDKMAYELSINWFEVRK